MDCTINKLSQTTAKEKNKHQSILPKKEFISVEDY